MSRRHLTLDAVCTDHTEPRGVPTRPTAAVGLFDLNESGVPARTRAVSLGADHDSWYDLDERLTIALGRAPADSHDALSAHVAGALEGADEIHIFTSAIRFELSNVGFEVVSSPDSLDLANGDPVVISTTPTPLDSCDAERPVVVPLGTGFDSITHLRNQLTRASQTGKPTRCIPADAATALDDTDFVRAYTLVIQFSVTSPDASASPTE